MLKALAFQGRRTAEKSTALEGHRTRDAGIHAETQNSSRNGDVTINFRRTCLRVCDADGEHAGPFQAGSQATFSTRLPGGLVLVWEEPTARRGHQRNAFLAACGKLNSQGVHDPRWCYLSHHRVVTRAIGGKEPAAVEIGSGRHRGYAENWVALHREGDPVLRFQVGYPKPTQKQNRAIRPHTFSVLVNGREIWSESVGSADSWLARQVPLGEFKGRTVLLTLSVEEQTEQDVGPTHTDPPSLFGNVYVDGNPISFGPLDGSALPRPAEVLWTDFFDAKGIDSAWTLANSPANQKRNYAPRVEDGKLSMAGSHYKHQYLARPLAESNPIVQARLQMGLTGSSAAWNAGIGLYWDKGRRYAFMTTGGYHDDNMAFHIRGAGQRTIPLEERTMRLLDDNACDCWVRIEVDAKTIRYASSLDGKTWHTELEVPRPEAMSGPPKLIIVGRGEEGDAPVFQNDRPHDSSLIPARISELVVGRCTSANP